MSDGDVFRVLAWLDTGRANELELTQLDRLVLLTVADRANSRTGRSSPGAEMVANRCGVRRDAASRSISRLHGKGLLATERRAHGQKRAASYRLSGDLADAPVPDRYAARSDQITQITPDQSKGDLDRPTSDPGDVSAGQPGSGQVGLSDEPSAGSGLSVAETGFSVASQQNSVAGGQRSLPQFYRSDNGGRTDDDASRRASQGVGAPYASDDVVTLVADTLELDPADARTWIGERLQGRTVRNPDAYIRKALANTQPSSASVRPKRGRAAKESGSKGGKATAGSARSSGLRCQDCGKVCKNAQGLSLHRSAKHKQCCPNGCGTELLPEEMSDGHCAPCDECQRLIPTRTLPRHMEVHHGKERRT